MSEDKNLKGVQDDLEFDEMTEALIETGEADGNASGEETEEVSSESESEPVVSLSLQFGEKTIGLDVTADFAVDFPLLCNDIGARPDAFEYEGEIPADVLMTLTKACK